MAMVKCKIVNTDLFCTFSTELHNICTYHDAVRSIYKCETICSIKLVVLFMLVYLSIMGYSLACIPVGAWKFDAFCQFRALFIFHVFFTCSHIRHCTRI